MPELTRLLDEFNGLKICDMSAEQQKRFFTAIAQRGAFEALSATGLNDENALKDVSDLRALIKGYRVLKRGVWSAAITQAGKVVSAIMTLLLLGWMFDHEKAEAIVKIMAGK